LIEESDWDETKNQARAAPEPDVLMKHVESDDGKHKQDLFHGGEKVSSRFAECQERYSHKRHKKILRRATQNLFVPLCLFVARP
jgi:hypothetical protein